MNREEEIKLDFNNQTGETAKTISPISYNIWIIETENGNTYLVNPNHKSEKESNLR